jgi:ectoine hydroxylase-related dioxygenase (phytanoyl-CoA dioxygenase family)
VERYEANDPHHTKTQMTAIDATEASLGAGQHRPSAIYSTSSARSHNERTTSFRDPPTREAHPMSITTTEEALRAIGVTDNELTTTQTQQLEDNGYFMVPGYFSPEQVDALRVAADKAAETAKIRDDLSIEPGRSVFLVDLLNKGEVFDWCLSCRPTLAAAHLLLGEIRAYSLQGRNPSKGTGQQALHSDVPRLGPTDWRLVNTMILLDDVSEENGATRLVPGSHKLPPLNVPSGNLGNVALKEPTNSEKLLLPDDPFAPHPDEVRVTGTAGTICVINGCVWHGGTMNKSGAPRRVLHMAIGRRDIPSHQDHRATLTPSLWERATPAMRYLLDIEGARPQAADYG